jgi:hypothetical protein
MTGADITGVPVRTALQQIVFVDDHYLVTGLL